MRPDPVPILSSDNVKRIEEIISKYKIDAILEFGSGNSTLYFLKKYKSQKIKFISVENSKSWFYKNIKLIKSSFQIKNVILNRKFWSFRNYKNFFDLNHSPYTPIQHGVSRVERWKRQMDLGPFFRFEPDSTSKMAGKFRTLKPFFKFINFFLRNIPKFNNETTEWRCKIQNCEFIYHLVSPGMKDQFGESPNRDIYLNLPLKSLDLNDKNIMVMIDGGPRHYIVDKIINILSNKNLHICLFDGHRPEYLEILKKFDGKFYKGSDNLLNGYKYHKTAYPDKIERDFVKSHELWYFFSSSK